MRIISSLRSALVVLVASVISVSGGAGAFGQTPTPTPAATGTPDLPVLVLEKDSVSLDLSSTLPSGSGAPKWEIDVLTLEGKSYADLAAELYSVIRPLRYAGAVSSRHAILDSCAANFSKRDKNWQAFLQELAALAGTRQQATALGSFIRKWTGNLDPRRCRQYLLADGKTLIPTTVEELAQVTLSGAALDLPLGPSFEPACVLPAQPGGEKVVALCEKSIPVPPISAALKNRKLSLVRLTEGAASAIVEIRPKSSRTPSRTDNKAAKGPNPILQFVVEVRSLAAPPTPTPTGASVGVTPGAPLATPTPKGVAATPTVPSSPTPPVVSDFTSYPAPTVAPLMVHGTNKDVCIGRVCTDSKGIIYSKDTKQALRPDPKTGRCTWTDLGQCVDAQGVPFYYLNNCVYVGRFPHGWASGCLKFDGGPEPLLPKEKPVADIFLTLTAGLFREYPTGWNSNIQRFDKAIAGHDPAHGRYVGEGDSVSLGRSFKRVWDFDPRGLNFDDAPQRMTLRGDGVEAVLSAPANSGALPQSSVPVTLPFPTTQPFRLDGLSDAQKQLLNTDGLVRYLATLRNLPSLELATLKAEETLGALTVEVLQQAPVRNESNVGVANAQSSLVADEVGKEPTFIAQVKWDKTSLFDYRNDRAIALNEVAETDQVSVQRFNQVAIRNNSEDGICVGFLRYHSSSTLKVPLPLDRVPLFVEPGAKTILEFNSITPIIKANKEDVETCGGKLKSLADEAKESYDLVVGLVSCLDRKPIRVMTFKLDPVVAEKDSNDPSPSCNLDSSPTMSGEGNFACPPGLVPRWKTIASRQQAAQCGTGATLSTSLSETYQLIDNYGVPSYAAGREQKVLSCECPEGLMLGSDGTCGPLNCAAGSVPSTDNSGCVCDTAQGYELDPCTGQCRPIDCGAAQLSLSPPPGMEGCADAPPVHCSCPRGLQFNDGKCQPPDCGPNSSFDALKGSCQCDSGFEPASDEGGGTPGLQCPRAGDESAAAPTPKGCQPASQEEEPDKGCPEGMIQKEDWCANGEKIQGTDKSWTCRAKGCDKNGVFSSWEYKASEPSKSCSCPDGNYYDPALKQCVPMSCPPGQQPQSLPQAQAEACPPPVQPFTCAPVCDDPNSFFVDVGGGRYACQCNEGFVFNLMTNRCDAPLQCEHGQWFNPQTWACEDVCPDGMLFESFDPATLQRVCNCPEGQQLVGGVCFGPCPDDSYLAEVNGLPVCVPRCTEGVYQNGACLTTVMEPCSSTPTSDSSYSSSSSSYSSGGSYSSDSYFDSSYSDSAGSNTSGGQGASDGASSFSYSYNSSAASESSSSGSSTSSGDGLCPRLVWVPAATGGSFPTKEAGSLEPVAPAEPPVRNSETAVITAPSIPLGSTKSSSPKYFPVPYLGKAIRALTQRIGSIVPPIAPNASGDVGGVRSGGGVSSADPKPEKSIQELLDTVESPDLALDQMFNALKELIARLKAQKNVDAETQSILRQLGLADGMDPAKIGERLKNLGPSKVQELIAQLARKLLEPSQNGSGKKTYNEVKTELAKLLQKLRDAASAVRAAIVPSRDGYFDIVTHLFTDRSWKSRVKNAMRAYRQASDELRAWMAQNFKELTDAARARVMQEIGEESEFQNSLINSLIKQYELAGTDVIGRISIAKTPLDLVGASIGVYLAMQSKNPELIALAIGAFTYAMEELRAIKDAAIASGMSVDEFIRKRGEMDPEFQKRAIKSAVFAAVLTEAFLRAKWGADKMSASGAARAAMYQKIIKGLELAGISMAGLSIGVDSLWPAIDALIAGDYKKFADKAADAGIDGAQLLNLVNILRKFGIAEIPVAKKPGSDTPHNPDAPKDPVTNPDGDSPIEVHKSPINGGSGAVLSRSTKIYRFEPAQDDTPLTPHESPFFEPEQYGFPYGVLGKQHKVLYFVTGDCLGKFTDYIKSRRYFEYEVVLRETTLGELIDRTGPDFKIYDDVKFNGTVLEQDSGAFVFVTPNK